MNIIHIAILALNLVTAGLAYNQNDKSSNLAWLAASAMVTKVIVDEYKKEKIKKIEKEEPAPVNLAVNESEKNLNN